MKLGICIFCNLNFVIWNLQILRSDLRRCYTEHTMLITILVVLAIIAFAANGYKVGSIETLGRVLGAVIGFIVAKSLVSSVVGYVSHYVSSDWTFLVSFLVIFLVVDSLVGWLFSLAEKLLKIFTRLPILRQVNSFLGLILGLIEGIIVIGGATWLLERSAIAGNMHSFSSTTIVQWIKLIFTFVFSILV
jgi:hypothetical protein